MADYYDWFKFLHIISLISWMAGMLYLPRLFVYHTEVEIGTNEDKRFQIMEFRLQKYIMLPALLSTIFFGLLVSHIYGFGNLGTWFYLKVIFVILLLAAHGYFSLCRKSFIYGRNTHSKTFYKILNEVPTILMLIIVWLVVLKPFEG
jgi:protoporphyrinogen IX oxidase